MDNTQQSQEGSEDRFPALGKYEDVHRWVEQHGGAVLPTRSSIDWFIRENRDELVKRGALIPRRGRSGSLVHCEEFPRAVEEIFRRRALGAP